jgi:hypothetical protein
VRWDDEIRFAAALTDALLGYNRRLLNLLSLARSIIRSAPLLSITSLLATSCRPHGHALRDVERHDRPVAAQPLVRDHEAVFFVGNSFFGWQGRQLPEWVSALGAALSPPVRIETGADIVFGNTPLASFLTHGATREALASRKYRVFVLQGEEYEAVDHKAAFHQAVRDFNRAVVAAGGRTVLFMTWEFRWRPFTDELAASYDEIGRELDIPVIPVGLIYRDCDQSPFGGAAPHWLTADADHPAGDLHPNARGTAVNTYATFEMLTGIDPLGRNFVAPGNTNDDAIMRYFSKMAWARVFPRLRAPAR